MNACRPLLGICLLGQLVFFEQVSTERKQSRKDNTWEYSTA